MTLDLRARLSRSPASCGWTTSSPTSRWCFGASLLKAVSVAALLALYVSRRLPVATSVRDDLDRGRDRRAGYARSCSRCSTAAGASEGSTERAALGRLTSRAEKPSVSLRRARREAPDGFRRRLGVRSRSSRRGVRASSSARLWQLQVERGRLSPHALREQPRPPEARQRHARARSTTATAQPLVDNRPSFDVVIVPEDARRPAGGTRRASAGFLAPGHGRRAPGARRRVGEPSSAVRGRRAPPRRRLGRRSSRSRRVRSSCRACRCRSVRGATIPTARSRRICSATSAR